MADMPLKTPALHAILIFVAAAICWLMPDALSAFIASAIAAGLAFALAWRAQNETSKEASNEASAEDSAVPFAPIVPATPALHAAPNGAAPGDTADYNARLKTVRHDVRNALSPALLLADRLSMADDADKKKTGDQIARAITRAVELLKQG